MNEHQELPLAGGRATEGVVRIGETVRRPIGSHSVFTHALLKRLEEKRIVSVPRFLGVDEKGREILTFIAGEVPHGDIMWTNDQLLKAVRILRAFHDATAGSELAGDQEVVCHNDLGPWNIVLKNGDPIAFIDYDDATPGKRVDDLAYFLWTFLELGADVSPKEQASRMQILCDAYGYMDISKLLDAILEQQAKILAKRQEWAQTAASLEAREFSAKKIPEIQAEMKWVQTHRATLEECFHKAVNTDCISGIT